MSIHPYIILPRLLFQLAMGMAVQIDAALADLIPGPEGIVAQDQVPALDMQLGVVLDAGPAPGTGRRLGIVIANYKMLGAMKLIQQVLDVSTASLGKIAKMPDLISLVHDSIPIGDQGRIMLFKGLEWTPVYDKHSPVGEMRVGCEEKRHSACLALLPCAPNNSPRMAVGSFPAEVAA